MKVAVIGAGMAGLTVARELKDAGADVTVFEKGKVAGGRLASRSVDGGWVDYGAPYFAAESAAFSAYLEKQVDAETLRIWDPMVSGHLKAEELSYYIGVPHNSAVPHLLLSGLNFEPSTRIARIDACDEGWQLFDDGEVLLGVWSQVVIAIPAPQALMLLLEQPDLAEQLKRVKMDPCWVAAVQSDQALPLLAEVSVYEENVIRRVINNSAKPLRKNKNVYLLQACKQWSETHFDEPAANIASELLRSFSALPSAEADSELLFVHRWRYAFTDVALGKPCLWDESRQIGVCGDWCIGRLAEDAWQSGMELSQAMIHTNEKGGGR